MEICHLQWNTAHRTSTSRTRHRGTAAKGDAWLYPAWFVATELTGPKSSWLLCSEYSAGESVRNAIREHRWTEVQTSSGMGKTGSRNHCISDQAVASPS